MAKRVGACLVWVLAVENTLARDCDSINVSQKAPLGLQVVAFQFNLDVRVTSAYPSIPDMTLRRRERPKGPTSESASNRAPFSRLRNVANTPSYVSDPRIWPIVSR
jgi:hypothetical protein